MERIELVKGIEANAERILEDFTEILQYLRSGGSDKCDEVQNLLFASRRTVDLIDSALEMYHYFVRLKYLTADVEKPEAMDKRDGGKMLANMFGELNANLGV
ncbi:hypothetical protein [Encephalitozoon cuniculi GB-M1]|uniref:Uncharacterized protein n=2 Tax=Encephalitozoon cuniculi TaxID=6035 RepID=Q8SVX2_ENCCU|nr:uncharacterized protein ECU04_0340 [Encephalitozoon cuniculi GB-M1]AGE95342.1 hypothetical protein ECU04_0340 [Encephalitozoon cuniculi]KMV66236.1 hypothetical protein M970_040250 [Encephalitozoon cuniculi EcunIII-L]UYI27409.1 hypothetical protein J0A71_06g12780 [Encephalitozoon cuniculi]CAD25221.1 hypothetical protein [Encephalitozoon cuniculi GB-M1]